MAYYQKLLTNEHTGESVLLKSNDAFTLQSKIQKKREVWERQYERKSQIEEKEHAIETASEQTKRAQEEILAYRGLLRATLAINDVVDWNSLKETKPYKTYEPKHKPLWEEYTWSIPKKSFLELVSHFKNKRIEAEKKAKASFEKASKEYEEDEKKRKIQYAKELESYKEEQDKHNAGLGKTQKLYEQGRNPGVEEYFALVLSRSSYPDSLDLYSAVEYDPHTKVLIVSMDLPSTTQVPKIKEYKYVSARKETVTVDMGKNEFDEYYNDVIFQITLRTIHEIFESDYAKVVDMVVYNGWVDGTDARTGKDFKNCIVSVQVQREQFLEINLERIQAKECFKHLKGVSAGSLVNLAPVKPIMKMKEEDERIISADAVIGTMDAGQNLATMDWQEFEVLVRDLIGKEFSREGCKVEVTRASRDAGVDAIAFDQDPIRGGKYVIQAKRYNNLVPVSAVRDLFGTVMNEGAVKGILITTSYYGPDALEFVKNKPLTLINGEELLYMFNKHGYDFKIELTKKQRAMSSVAY